MDAIGLNIFSSLIGAAIGAAFSWFIARYYYIKALEVSKESSKSMEDFIERVFKNLPSGSISRERLLEIFQESLNNGFEKIDPLTGKVACPECFTPSDQFKYTHFGDDAHDIVVVSCESCGWSETLEV